jgi:hypothetical protein
MLMMTWLTPCPCPNADWPRLNTPTFETRLLFSSHRKGLAVLSIQENQSMSAGKSLGEY